VYEKDGFVSQKLALHVQPEQLTEVQAALAMDQGTSELVVDCNVEEAALSVDGKEVGRTPFAGTIPSGEHILQVWAPNHLAWTGVIDAPAKKAVSVQARLVPTTSPTATIATPTVVYDEQGGWSLSTWGWITMGAGVAAAGMGGYFYYVMLDKATQANEVGSGPKFDKLQTEVQTNWMYTMVFLGAGGAVVGGGLLMVLLDPGSDDEDSTPLDLLVLSPSATPGGAAVNAMFSF
jgi:hypothetical protein